MATITQVLIVHTRKSLPLSWAVIHNLSERPQNSLRCHSGGDFLKFSLRLPRKLFIARYLPRGTLLQSHPRMVPGELLATIMGTAEAADAAESGTLESI